MNQRNVLGVPGHKIRLIDTVDSYESAERYGMYIAAEGAGNADRRCLT